MLRSHFAATADDCRPIVNPAIHEIRVSYRVEICTLFQNIYRRAIGQEILVDFDKTIGIGAD